MHCHMTRRHSVSNIGHEDVSGLQCACFEGCDMPKMPCPAHVMHWGCCRCHCVCQLIAGIAASSHCWLLAGEVACHSSGSVARLYPAAGPTCKVFQLLLGCLVCKLLWDGGCFALLCTWGSPARGRKGMACMCFVGIALHSAATVGTQR